MGEIKLSQKPVPNSLDAKEFPVQFNPIDGAFGEDEFSIETFKKQLERTGGDLARQNKFKVSIVPPDVLQDEFQNDFVSAMVKKVNMPQVMVNDFPFERAGKILHIPTHTTFEDLNITFHNDVNHYMRNLMLKWQKICLSNWTDNITSVPILSLSGRIMVLQYNASNQFTSLIEMVNCWPKVVSGVDFGQDSDNTFNDFTVTFTYTEQIIGTNTQVYQ